MEERGTTSYFVTNFPETFGNEDMWKVFIKWGRERDVYIPSKTDKFGKRFAFVRFSDVQQPKSLDAQLDTIWIGDYKLKANLPLFNRENVGGNVGKNH